MRSHGLILLSLALALPSLGGCDAYSPDLGEEPFRCGTSEPRCPEGYGPVQDGFLCLCERGASTTGPDSATQACADDSAFTRDPGGNETIDTAADSPVGRGASTWSQPGMSICPAEDVDVFSLLVSENNTVIDVSIQFSAETGKLDLAILNTPGTQLATGTEQVGGMGVSYTATVPGTYYAKISAAEGLPNDYAIMIQTR